MSTPDRDRLTAGCGLDTVEIARVERLLRETPPEDLRRMFSEEELADAGDGPRRAESLAARFAGKEACCKLFPRETGLGRIDPTEFSISRDEYGAPRVRPTRSAQAVLDRHWIADIRISLTHTSTSASAVAWPERKQIRVPWYGTLLYYLFPFRRAVVKRNLHRVFAGYLTRAERHDLARAYWAHFALYVAELVRLRFMSAKKRQSLVRVENTESPVKASRSGKGVIILTGHFGNWELSTVAAIAELPEYRDRLHFVRKNLQPKWLDSLVTRRFKKAGFGTLTRKGSLDKILDILGEGGAGVVFVFDQHAGGKGHNAIPCEFFGRKASTYKSVAVLALATGAQVIPASSWREPDGSHIVRFEDPLTLIDCENTNEAVLRNTRQFNQAIERMLLRHPEQWIWMHRRWKLGR